MPYNMQQLRSACVRMHVHKTVLGARPPPPTRSAPPHTHTRPILAPMLQQYAPRCTHPPPPFPLPLPPGPGPGRLVALCFPLPPCARVQLSQQSRPLRYPDHQNVMDLRRARHDVTALPMSARQKREAGRQIALRTAQLRQVRAVVGCAVQRGAVLCGADGRQGNRSWGRMRRAGARA